MNDQELIKKLLSDLQSAALKVGNKDICPHPLDPEIEQLIEAWARLPDTEREHTTANLTDTQRTHLFQFTHRFPLRAEGMRKRADKLALIRMGILANTMEGFSRYSVNEITSNFMSVSLVLEIARPWPTRTLIPLWDEAIRLASPKTRYWLLVRYADKTLKEKYEDAPVVKSGIWG